jgi:hypothetical protein
MAGGIRENTEAVRRAMERAAGRAGRPPAEITLLAVSKAVGAGAVREAFEAGINAFGESRVQEAGRKMAALGGLGISWHFIGHLQTNKARAAASGGFELIHSVDSVKLLRELDRHAAAVGPFGKIQLALVEVKLSHEETKHGVSPEKMDEVLAASEGMKNVRIEGLMTIPPYFEDPEESRPYYRRLRELRDAYQVEGFSLPVLSMGMSHDFEVAIEEGATIIRVGTAIFGQRTA